MNEKSKGRLLAFFWIVVAAIVAWFFVWRPHQQSKITKARAALAQLERAKSIRELAAKYGASQDWEMTVTNHATIFTIDIQNAFLNSSRPLEFIGKLVDVRRVGNHIVADFNYEAFTPSVILPTSLALRISCTDEQRKVLGHRQADYVIIVKIEKVTKQGELNITDVEDQSIVANWDTDTYWLTGSCLDVRKLDE